MNNPKTNPPTRLEKMLEQLTFAICKQETVLPIKEKANTYLADVKVGNVDPKTLSVHIRDNNITIKGIREDTKEWKDKLHFHREIQRNFFTKIVELPRKINKDLASIKYEHGHVKLILPKAIETNYIASE